MSLTFVIADLHGRFDLLADALMRITEYAAGGTIVFTGDYIDRGPQSAQIIKLLRGGPPIHWRWICLQGNHEDIMMQTVRQPLHKDWWFSNGGRFTVNSYWDLYEDRQFDEEQNEQRVVAFLRSDAEWMMGLPLYHYDAHRMFVHAAALPTYSLENQPREVLQWMIYSPENRDVGLVDGCHVVHGHHQWADGPRLYPNRSNFDTFAWLTGRLVVGVFDDAVAGGPIDFIEVIGEPTDLQAWRSAR